MNIQEVNIIDNFFTEKNFTFTNSSYDIKAVRLDANRSFQKLMTGIIRGNILVKDENIN